MDEGSDELMVFVSKVPEDVSVFLIGELCYVSHMHSYEDNISTYVKLLFFCNTVLYRI